MIREIETAETAIQTPRGICTLSFAKARASTMRSTVSHSTRSHLVVNARTDAPPQILFPHKKHSDLPALDRALKIIRERTNPLARRKDAVRVIEILVELNIEARDNLSKQEIRDYLKDSFHFLADEFGRENVVFAAAHYDEISPHMHVFVTPITSTGKLCAKEMLNGPSAIKAMRTRFAEKVGRKFGLIRGAIHDAESRPRHKSIKQLYGKLREAMQADVVNDDNREALATAGLLSFGAAARDVQMLRAQVQDLQRQRESLKSLVSELQSEVQQSVNQVRQIADEFASGD